MSINLSNILSEIDEEVLENHAKYLEINNYYSTPIEPLLKYRMARLRIMKNNSVVIRYLIGFNMTSVKDYVEYIPGNKIETLVYYEIE